MSLFFVEQVGLALYLEFLYVVFPSCLDFFGALPFLYHFAHVVGAYQQFEEGTEEVIVHVQIPVSVYHVTQVNTAFPDFLVAHVAQVHAVAKLVQLGWILGSGNTARGEAVAVARHVGMPVDLEGEVGSSSQTDRSGLEIAGRGVQIDGLHVRQIGGRGNRQLV